MKITSNLKSTKEWSIDLDDKVLLIGDSASGKSAVTQSIELAVSKRVSDVQGRVDSSERTVGKILSGDYDRAEVTYTGVATELPYRTIREAVTSEPLNALLALTQLSIPEVDEARAYHRTVKSSRAALSSIETVIEVTERFGGLPVGSALLVQLTGEIARLRAELETAERSRERSERMLWPDLVEAVQKLVHCARKFVPKALGELTIDAGDADQLRCRAGFNRRFALSGSEWNIALTALACAYSEEILGEPTKCLVIPDDRAISPKLLTEWLKALSSAKCQVILTSVIEPSSVPKGWQIVRVRTVGEFQIDGDSRRSGSASQPSSRLSRKRPKLSESRVGGSTSSSSRAESRRK